MKLLVSVKMLPREVAEFIFSLIVGCTFIGRDRSLKCTGLNEYYEIREELNVKRLDINSRGMYEMLRKDSFKNFTNITELNIIESVGEIEVGAFDGIKYLKFFGLNNNNITVLKADTFRNLDVGNLYFWDSYVHELEIGVFNKIKRIERIWFDSNYLTVIRKGVFTDKSFEEIHIHNNDLRHIEPGAFSGIDTLIELDLGSNLLESFEAREIGLGSSLKKLFIQINSLTTLNQTTFAGLTNLRVLNISSNFLSSINEQTFGPDLKHLQILDLSYNNLIELNPNAFHTDSPISSLFLQTNNLTYISLEVLEHLPKLQNISIVYNPWQCSCQTDFKNKLTEKNITSLCENSEQNSICFTETSECVFEVGKSIIINKKHEVDKKQICVTEYWEYYSD